MNQTPPKISSANAWCAFALLGLAAAAAGAIVFFFNPASSGFYPACQFHRLTGLNCPGCGGTRAVYALLHGHFSTALHDNALFVTGTCFTALRGGWWWWKKRRGQAVEFFPSKFLLPLLVVTIVFTVLRNLPAFAFLSP